VADAPTRDQFERVWLDEHSWVDVARGWLADADAVHEALLARAAWHPNRLWRYERWVEEPRLGAQALVDGRPVHDVLPRLRRSLQDQYEVPFGAAGLALYRDGRDSVAFHRDRELRWLEDTRIAVLSLGQRRPWLLRPRTNRYAHHLPDHGATHDLSPASGDLIVMGGRCQTDWEHSVPKVPKRIGPRISLQWRWTSRRGQQVRGGNFRDPRFFSR
jgi:alkylated DNA repair dioxygenase AlkB